MRPTAPLLLAVSLTLTLASGAETQSLDSSRIAVEPLRVGESIRIFPDSLLRPPAWCDGSYLATTGDTLVFQPAGGEVPFAIATARVERVEVFRPGPDSWRGRGRRGVFGMAVGAAMGPAATYLAFLYGTLICYELLLRPCDFLARWLRPVAVGSAIVGGALGAAAGLQSNPPLVPRPAAIPVDSALGVRPGETVPYSRWIADQATRCGPRPSRRGAVPVRTPGGHLRR